jgi:cation diffusion facilitator family transporter
VGAKGTLFEEMGRRRKAAARVSVVSNTGLVLGKLAVGILMGSVAVISEAIHSSIDLLAALIAVYAVHKSAQPADDDHAYGHGKYEDLSGSIEAVLIIVAAVVIMYEAVKRLIEGGDVGMPLLGVAVMGMSVVVNLAVSRYLFKVAHETSSVALEADALHLSTDVWTSLGVMAAMVAIWATDWHVLDPIVAIGVAVLIIFAAWNLTRRTIKDLVDAPLPEEDRLAILTVLNEHKGMHIGYDSLRTRRAGPDRHIDMHLHFPPSMPVAEAHDLSHHIQLEIEERLGHAQVLIHLEPCELPCRECDKEACTDRAMGPAGAPPADSGEGDEGEFH